MYYDMDIAQTDARVFGGGAQDNGTLATNTGNAHEFFELLGGDGGWIAIDPRDAGHIFASFQFGGMYRFRNGGFRKVTPPFRDEDMGGVWMVYITFDPNDSEVVYTGNQRVYCSRNDGLSWNALTPSLDGSPISAIEVAAADSRCVYVATENGGFFRSLDGGVNWSANLANSTLPSVMITRVASHPTNAREVCITVANFGNSHVFRSTDAGSTWADIDRRQLPDVPHHALLYRPDAPQNLYVCNDAGVYLTRDGGASWLDSTLKLPNAMVVDLVYQRNAKTLCAATYGRGLWQLQLG
jgi:ligand-binding sensor domain-containing protein